METDQQLPAATSQQLPGDPTAPDPALTAAADVARLRALLADLQWRGPKRVMPTHQLEATCPDCGAFQPNGHDRDTCRVAAELR
jgi:hypothetical protein